MPWCMRKVSVAPGLSTQTQLRRIPCCNADQRQYFVPLSNFHFRFGALADGDAYWLGGGFGAAHYCAVRLSLRRESRLLHCLLPGESLAGRFHASASAWIMQSRFNILSNGAVLASFIRSNWPQRWKGATFPLVCRHAFERTTPDIMTTRRACIRQVATTPPARWRQQQQRLVAAAAAPQAAAAASRPTGWRVVP